MEWLRLFWDAAIAVNADARAMDQAERYSICNPDALHTLFVDGGFSQIDVAPITVDSYFVDFADYWGPLSAGGPVPAPTYLASRPQDEREAIRVAVLERLPVQEDGSITLGMRAWAIRGAA